MTTMDASSNKTGRAGGAISTALFALTLCGCASVAATLYPISSDVLKARPGDYALDPAHANVYFAVDHSGLSTFHGRFNDVSGRLRLDTDNPENSEAAIRIAASSIDTISEELDGLLKSSGMFDVARFTEILFISQHVTRTGENTADITGALTIKNVTRPLVLHVEFNGSGVRPLNGRKVVGFSADAAIKRSEFGLDRWFPIVGDDVALEIDAEFEMAS